MIVIDGNTLDLDKFINVARLKEEIQLSEESIDKIIASRMIVEEIVRKDEIVYGITTGFGKLANVKIDRDDVSKLQENIIKSHACSVGDGFSDEIVRGIMLLRINALSKGYSGIRLETIEKLIELLNADVLPFIPEQGSLGASGDLAPLSHMALPLIGLGKVRYKGILYNTDALFNELGIDALDGLYAKEGLALINGTQAMTSVGAITLYDAMQLSIMADAAAAMTMEAFYGIDHAFYSKVHELRPHAGQLETAKNILGLLEGSQLINNRLERVQDPYTIRCIPQVHGASKDCFNHVLDKLLIEMNSVTDNPLIFEDDVISAGNFHGQPLALAFDYLKVGIAELANISERRLERMVNPQLSEGLPPFLVNNSGLNSGFMIVQYSAASLVSENKVIAHPASVDSITSSGNQEDHVSMGTTSARGALQILKNTQKVIAMEIMTSAQALDFREESKYGRGTKLVYDLVREVVPFIEEDVVMADYMNEVIHLVSTNKISHVLESTMNHLVG